LPGIPLACVRAGPTTLVDSIARRADFLRKVSSELGLDVVVVVGRAEDQARSSLRGSFDVAVTRALAPPAVAFELTLPFLRPGGVLAVLMTPRTRVDGDQTPEWDVSSGRAGEREHTARPPVDISSVAGGQHTDALDGLEGVEKDSERPRPGPDDLRDPLEPLEGVAVQLGGGG